MTSMKTDLFAFNGGSTIQIPPTAVGGLFRSDLQNASQPVYVFILFLANARKTDYKNNNGSAVLSM